MSELDHLGDALREQLHTLVADVNPSASLWASVDAIPMTGRRARWRARLTRRRIAFTMPVPIAAVVAAAVLVFGGATPTASLGSNVTWLPNGAFRMPDIDWQRTAFADAVFRRAHFSGVAVPMTAACSDRDWSYSVETIHPRVVNLYLPTKGSKNWTVVYAAKPIAPNILETAVSRFRRGSKLPSCASTHGWGMGMGSGRGYKIWPPPDGQRG